MYQTILLFIATLFSLNLVATERINPQEFARRVQEREFIAHLCAGCGIMSFLVNGDGAIGNDIADAMIRLRAQGFSVQGERLQQEEFDGLIRELEAAENTYLVEGEGILLPTRRAFLQTVCHKLGQIRNPQVFFGVPQGVALPQSFRIFPERDNVRRLLLTELAQNIIISGTLYYKFGQSFKGLPNLVLSTYLYLYMSNLSEVLRIKNQGGSLAEIESFGRNRIQIEPHIGPILAQTSIEEILSSLIVQSSFLTTRDMLEHLPNTLFDSGLLAFAKGLTEKMIGKLIDEKRLYESLGDFSKAEACKNKIEIFQHVFYNGLFPFLKALQLPSNESASRYFSNTVQGLMGLAGIVGTNPQLLPSLKAPRNQKGSCAMLFRFLSK